MFGAANTALLLALGNNPWCAVYLLKLQQYLRKELPESYAPGSRDEARVFLKTQGIAWTRDTSAHLWLAQTFGDCLKEDGSDNHFANCAGRQVALNPPLRNGRECLAFRWVGPSGTMDEADSRLNQLHKMLQGRLSPEKMTALRTEQRQWIKNRDAAIKSSLARAGLSSTGKDGKPVSDEITLKWTLERCADLERRAK